MISDVVITEQMASGTKEQPQDGVGLGSYAFDSHAIKYYVDSESGFVSTDGGLSRPPFSRVPPPYPISYRSIIPKKAECENLLVPVCVSATHVAYGSLRMEPVFMILGQSAATAAALALDRNLALQDLDYAELEKRLLADGQVLKWERPRSAAPAAPAQLAKDLQLLFDRQVFTDLNYWKSNAVAGGHCEGARVAELMMKGAQQIAPANTAEEAIAVFQRERILTSPTYWRENAVPGGFCSGTHVARIVQNLAERLRQQK
jgi:hypothetical protein